jgi:signal peptidase I
MMRGDVVVAKSPTKSEQTVCKRVRALAGDTVFVPGGAAPFYGGQAVRVVIPEGHVWLEGDNPLNSTDSRYYGPIPSSMVQGRVFLKVISVCFQINHSSFYQLSFTIDCPCILLLTQIDLAFIGVGVQFTTP